MPTLIGLVVAVGCCALRDSLTFCQELSGSSRNTSVFRRTGAAYGGKDVLIFGGHRAASGCVQGYGTDSYIGLVASISMSCTETIFYTMRRLFYDSQSHEDQIYSGGAMLATFAGLVASAVLAGMMVAG